MGPTGEYWETCTGSTEEEEEEEEEEEGKSISDYTPTGGTRRGLTLS